MRYLKTFESFTETDWRNIIENHKYFENVATFFESTNPEVKQAIEELEIELQKAETRKIELLFYDFESAAKMLGERLQTYVLENNFQNIDRRQLAIQALKYIMGLGVLSALVKLFYVGMRIAFDFLDEAGIGSVAGGVLVILLYYAIYGGKMVKKTDIQQQNVDNTSKKDGDYIDYEEL